MRIRTFNDPVLRRQAAPVKRVNWATRRLAAQMAETMRRTKGVGLAAPQVGVSSRIVVVDVGEGLNVLVNPAITASSGQETDWEGCLSFPGLLAEIQRAGNVTVQATGLDGKTHWIEGSGYLARALQHEIDHLDGVVILDRARDLEKVEPSETVEVEPGPDDVSGEAGRGASFEARETARPLRVAFLGTPDFGRPTLEALVAAGHEVVGVATQPDRPAGRGGKPRVSAVKATALAFGLPVWQGSGGEGRAELAALFRKWDADVAVVVAYGVILPAEVLGTPGLGCVNLHASLLPDYRGPAPIQRAIMDGRSVTGVTVINMDSGVDTGDILAQREVAIAPDDTAGSLHDRLATVGADLILHSLELLAAGTAVPRPQPAGRFPPAPRLAPQDEVIDWRRPAVEISRQVRALSPVPGAYAVYGGKRLKVLGADAMAGTAGSGWPGEILALDGGYPVIATGKGTLALRVVQPAGSSRMRGPDFVNGYHVAIGDRLETGPWGPTPGPDRED